MITDEQVNVACNRINERHSYTVASKKAMREVLETFEQSKWIKFNVNDSSTHPSVEQDVNAVTFRGKVVTMRFNGINDETGLPLWFWQGTDEQTNLTVTHWQHLPEFKE